MKRGRFLSFAVLMGMAAASGACHPTTIVWTNVLPGPVYSPARDSQGTPLPGCTFFGPWCQGALVQLLKAHGDIDDPRWVPEAYNYTDWTVDDEILQEVYIGFSGFFPQNYGLFSATVDAAATTGDVVYARVYNLPKDEWPEAPMSDRELGIRNSDGEIVSFEIGDPMAIHTFFFENLRTEPIPEPASLLFVVPGLAVWALLRRKRRFPINILEKGEHIVGKLLAERGSFFPGLLSPASRKATPLSFTKRAVPSARLSFLQRSGFRPQAPLCYSHRECE